MAFGMTISRLISLQSFAPASPALSKAAFQIGRGSACNLGSGAGAAAPQQQQQARCVVSAPVQNNKIGKAVRSISRRVFADKLLDKWRERQYYVKPAKARFIAGRDVVVRLRKEEFREKLRWAMQRKARGF